MKRLSFLLCALSTASLCLSDNSQIQEPSFLFGGYIKNESFWDSRQVVGVGADQVLLYPEKKIFDDRGNDINAKGQFNTVPIESNLWVKIKGPKVRNALSSAYIEGNFFGAIFPIDISNIIHLRNAIFKLNWQDLDLIIGQFWHPLYIVGCEPKTVGFNTGTPIEPFSRNPQICIRRPLGPFLLTATAASQIDFVSDGPIGPSATYLRHAVIPNFAGRLDWPINGHLIGVGLDFKRIRPRLETDLGLKTDETLSSWAAIAFTCLNWDTLTVANKITFAQNGTNLSLIGGYAVHSIDEQTDKRTYTNLNTIGFWTDWQFRADKPVRPGLFFGFIKSLGARTTILQNKIENGALVDRRIYGFGTDIDYVLRASGRVTWKLNDFEFGAELEYTRSPYGTIDECGKVKNSVPVGNTRFLLALYYYL